MELPIDHFRLLGVSPTTDAQGVLRMLEQRLNRVPDQGFTPETLQARESLLRLSADLLTDSRRRELYESELTSLASSGQPLQAALEIPSSREIGGLLLLLEADQPLECFNLARRGLQPPQAPTLGSGRETDLSLLAALACLAGAADLRRHRRYEAAAHLLREGLQLLQRMGQHPALRQQITDELRQLRPFRVLDLLSRNLAAIDERAEGLALLEELVRERGGLEGSNDPSLSPEEFQAFFKQIRAYLTVQEQVDLFSRWAENSQAADFLASTALTASGFAQRKPERIAAAQRRLEATGQEGIQPLLACLHLLLGQVEAAQQAFRRGASPELLQWAEHQSGDPLAQLCAYCSDWLSRDVLPGYRDLEADPDLEAYFADRDVQAYIERLAPPLIPADPPLASSFGSGWAPLGTDLTGGFPGGELSSSMGTPATASAPGEPHDDEEEEEPWIGGWLPEWPPHWRWNPDWKLPQFAALAPWLPRSRRSRLITAAAVAGVGVLVGGLWGLGRSRPEATPIPVESSQTRPGDTPPSQTGTATSPSPSPATGPSETTTAEGGSAAANPVPLRSSEPTEADLQALLVSWLDAKAAVLAGEADDPALSEMARPSQVDRLRQERREDAARSQTQRIEAKVSGLTIEERSPNRIAAVATIDYRDQRLGADGQAVGATASLTLRNRYVFGRDDGVWRLVSFAPVR